MLIHHCSWELRCLAHRTSLVMIQFKSLSLFLDPLIGSDWFFFQNYGHKHIHHLASLCISSPRDVALLSSRKILASVSLFDSEWRNLRDSIVLESILSSKGQFASSRLNINRDTWTTHQSVVMIEMQGRTLAYNQGINEEWNTNN